MKHVAGLLFIAVFIFFSCEDEVESRTFSLDTEVEFKKGEINYSDDKTVEFTISAINDSRCPEDVTCIWQGEAEITIDVESPAKGTIVLSTFDNLSDTIGNYSFKLIEVLPYPVSDQVIKLEDYRVTLEIAQL